MKLPNVWGMFAGRFARQKPDTNDVPPQGYVSGAALAATRKDEPKDQAELAEEMRRDYMVQFSEDVLWAHIATTQVAVAAEGGDARSEALSEQLQQLWINTLPSMREALGAGRVAYEKVWDYDAESNLNVIEKLEPLPFRETDMELDANGDYAGITLKTKGDGPDVVLSPQKSWWLAMSPTVLEPHGRSLYDGAPRKTWEERREAIRLRKLFLKRFALRGGVAHVPPTVKNEQTGLVEDNYEKMASAYEAYQAGALMMFPNTLLGDGKTRQYEWTEGPTTLDPSPIMLIIQGMDTEQLRAFGIPEKTVIEGESVGSFAMVSVQMKILLAVVEGLLMQLVNSFREKVIKNAVEVNYRGMQAPVVTISFPTLQDKMQEAEQQQQGEQVDADGNPVEPAPGDEKLPPKASPQKNIPQKKQNRV